MNKHVRIAVAAGLALVFLPFLGIMGVLMAFSASPAMSCASVSNAPASVQLTDHQLAVIKRHQDDLESAASANDIPPEAIVGIWFRENGLSENADIQAGNPFGGPYNRASTAYASYHHPEDLQDSFDIAAKMLQSKAKDGLFQQRISTAKFNPEVLKDAYFGYNGRSPAYADQAAALGFNSKSQPYEGSPYVMNDYDAKHKGMSIISHDFGSVDAIDSRPGAFTIFSMLFGADGAPIVGQLQCQTEASASDVALTNGWSLPINHGNYRVGVAFGTHGPEWSLGYHTGQDFPADEGTPIHAVADGVISFAGWTDSYGNETDEVINDGGKKVHVVYAHAVRRAPGIHEGVEVKAGQVIAYVGETGNAFGNHLHFEYRPYADDYKQAQDPIPWLRSHGLSP